MEENVYEIPDIKVFIDSNRCLYSVRMRENTDQKNSEYGRFSRSVSCTIMSSTDHVVICFSSNFMKFILGKHQSFLKSASTEICYHSNSQLFITSSEIIVG